MKRIKKSYFTLLEVLIAFFLILIALVPLFAPYSYMFKRQQEIVYELEMDRLAGLYYVDLLQQVLNKQLDPESFKPGEKKAIEQIELPIIPYKAEYVFGTNEVTVVFTSMNLQKEEKTYEFTYVLFKKGSQN